jgi:multiple sugar transport system substrate-binding protein
MKNLIMAGVFSLLTPTLSLAQTEIVVWHHAAGDQNFVDIITGIVAEFNASQQDWKVNMQSFPQASYNDAVSAAALAGNLPDVLDVDGPVMPSWAYAGYMQPLGLKDDVVAQFLPGTLGRWKGDLYSVGMWDAAVAMMTSKKILAKYDIRIPTLDKPWTQTEFDAALVKIKDSGDFEYPLDLGMAWKGEWYPYAFSPFLQSFGGDIVDRTSNKTAEGALNGEAAIAFGGWWQSLFARKLAPGTSQDPADREIGLIKGKYAMSWNGNWAALPVIEAFGDDALFLPAPDFGKGPIIGAASWQWGMSATTKHPEGARAFIEYAIQEAHLRKFSDGIGLIPSTPAAAKGSKNYSEGGKMAVFYDLSKQQALVRPVTPGYVVEAKVFEKALADIASGAEVATTLDAAVSEIDTDIKKNSGYGH